MGSHSRNEVTRGRVTLLSGRVISLSHPLLLNRLYLLFDLVPAETLGKPQITAGLQVHPELR
jgi:hypothetical protein